MPTTLPTDISLDGLNFTRAQEGRALRAYQDSVGVWTVGYGLTNFDKNLPWKVQKGLTITAEQAEWYLLKSIRENYVPAARKALDGGTYQHPQGAVDGATDFHFNTGGVLKATWPKALGAGDMAGAEQSMMSWNKAGGRILSGLTKRRAGNWLEVSAGEYGKLTGPGVIEPGADNQERQTGVGELLTAFPHDPNDATAGDVKRDGIPVPTTPAPGTLKFGDKGPEVSELQNDLTAAGYVTIATGTYDKETVSNVSAFQAAHPNLTQDGKAGPATRATIKRAVQMRSVGGKIIKTAAPGIPGVFIAFHNFVSANAGLIALALGVTALVVVGGYVVWKHRHDVHAWANGLIGRKVT